MTWSRSPWITYDNKAKLNKHCKLYRVYYFSYLKSRGFSIVHSTEAAMVLCPHIWKGKQDTWSYSNYTGDWKLHAICLPFSLSFSTTSEISKIFMGSGIFWLEAIVFSKPGSKLVRATYSGYACLRTARSVCVCVHVECVCGCMCACMCVCCVCMGVCLCVCV